MSVEMIIPHYAILYNPLKCKKIQSGWIKNETVAVHPRPGYSAFHENRKEHPSLLVTELCSHDLGREWVHRLSSLAGMISIILLMNSLYTCVYYFTYYNHSRAC